MQKVHSKSIDFDHASTGKLNPELAKDAFVLMSEYYGNADSLHEEGQRVSRLIESSHVALAKALGILPHEIFYTSGGSESNSWAIKGVAFANQNKGKHIITSKIEHASVLNACMYLERYFDFDVDYLDVDENGTIQADQLSKYLREDTILVSLFAINNELGSINPLEDLLKVIRKKSEAFFHVDAVQAFGKETLPLRRLDLVSVSAHKINGLKGSGLLIKKAGVPIHPLIHGGQQQQALRGGTLDFVPIILWPKTYRLALGNYHQNRKKIEEISEVLYDTFGNNEDFVIHSTQNGSPYIFNFSILGIGSEVMMNALNREGILVSAQSTCHSKNSYSHVLENLNVDPEALESNVRLSFSYENNLEEINYFIKKVMEIIDAVRL